MASLPGCARIDDRQSALSSVWTQQWLVCGWRVHSGSTQHGSPRRKPLLHHVKVDLCVCMKSTPFTRESGHMKSSMAGMLQRYKRDLPSASPCFRYSRQLRNAYTSVLVQGIPGSNYGLVMAAASSGSRCLSKP
jgi:hypothetical protein